MQPNTYNANPAQPSRLSRWQPWAIAAAIVVVVGIGIYAIISAIITQQTTGILDITASSNKATIGVQSTNDTTANKIGTGAASVRLTPGTYNVIASDGAAQTMVSATVTATHTTTLRVALAAPFKAEKLVETAGQNVYQTGSQFYFLKSVTTGLGQYQFGKPTTDEYLPDITQVAQVYWLDPTHFYNQGTDNDWFYYDGTTNQPLVSMGEEGDAANNNSQPFPNSVSINQKGQAAFVSVGHGIFLIDKPAATPRQLGTIGAATNVQASLAPNGDIVVSTPVISAGDKATTSRLYHDGTLSDLPTNLRGIANISWSPDSSHISYTTNNGIYVYDFASKKVTQILAVGPTNQLSVTWLSNTSLIYAQDGAIWRYRTDGTVSTKLATVEGVLNAARPFTLAADGQTVYFGTAPDSKNNGGALYGFIPNQDSVSKTELQTLQLNLQNAIGLQNFAGTDTLISRGLTTDQVDGLRQAFYLYGQQIHQHIADISIDTNTIADLPYDPQKPDPAQMSFIITLNKKDKLKAVIDIPGFRDTRLHLYNPATNQLVFDSQPITVVSAATD